MGDFEKLHNIATPTTDTLQFTSQNFRVIRIVLRLLSLWRPQSAGFFERYVYPVFVNLVLLCFGIVRNSLRAAEKSTSLNVEFLYLVHEFVIWLGHILANRYFASRDLEKNVLKPAKPLVGMVKPLNRSLKVLNPIVVISMAFFSIMLCVLYVVTSFEWHEGAERFSADLQFLHGPLDHVIYCFVIFSIVYNLGIGLALFWTLALLYTCYAARLKILEDIFLKWKHSSVDAVSYFLQFYAQPVRKSWKRMSWWFFAHNIVALGMPLYGYELAQAVTGRAYHSKHLPQLVCYLVFILAIWLSPIVMAEQFKRRERKFLERVNNISPWLLEAGIRSHSVGESEVRSIDERGVHEQPLSSASGLTQGLRQNTSLDSVGSNSPGESGNVPMYTFLCRGKEFNNFLQFLNQRTPGLVSRGYAMQLNLSLFSLICGTISFLTELRTMNQDIICRNCNCTMS